MAKPFVKMVGGKRKIAPRIAELLFPTQTILPDGARYYEPFLGGGAVFFHLVETGRINSHQAILTDVNEDLITTYRVVRDHVEGLIKVLNTFSYDSESYYKAREEYNALKSPSLMKAAYFIYLNKTCFNGLYRVNQKGEFNVPFGKYANPLICDAEGLRAASEALQGTRIEKASFKEILQDNVRAEDIVYCDPPYVEIVEGGFKNYTKEGFKAEDQMRLANIGAGHINGARIVLSNHDTPEVESWYSFGNLPVHHYYKVEKIQVARPVNRDGAKRGKVAEVLIYGGGA